MANLSIDCHSKQDRLIFPATEGPNEWLLRNKNTNSVILIVLGDEAVLVI